MTSAVSSFDDHESTGSSAGVSDFAKLSEEKNHEIGISVKELGPDDVLLGRGTGPNEYEGNVRFRALIRDIIQTSDIKDSEDCKAKTKLATKIVNTIKERNGRFLQKTTGGRSRSNKGHCFVIAPDKVALDKTKQSLRHQLRMMDPNFKENRERKLKIRKLREQMLQSSMTAAGPSFVEGNFKRDYFPSAAAVLQAPVVDLASALGRGEQQGPLLRLLAQRSQMNALQEDPALLSLLSSMPRTAASPMSHQGAVSAALSDLLLSGASSSSRNAVAAPAPSALAGLLGSPSSHHHLPPSQLRNFLLQSNGTAAPAPSSSSMADQSKLLQLLAAQQQQQQQAQASSVAVEAALLNMILEQRQRVSVL